MAQRPIILGFEPRLKGNFVAIIGVNVSDFAIELIGFVNFQICKNRRGIDLGHNFQIRLLLLL